MDDQPVMHNPVSGLPVGDKSPFRVLTSCQSVLSPVHDNNAMSNSLSSAKRIVSAILKTGRLTVPISLMLFLGCSKIPSDASSKSCFTQTAMISIDLSLFAICQTLFLKFSGVGIHRSYLLQPRSE